MAAEPEASAGADQTFAFGDLTTSASLSGSGTPSDSGSSIVSWSWSIVDGPSGHGASFDDATAQNPTLQNIDAAGTYLLFLEVTDDAGASSESRHRYAKDAAFCSIVVTTEHRALRVPAEGERWVAAHMKEALHALDTLAGALDTLKIADLDTTATGAQLNTLTGGGSASGLHTHAGSDIPAATTAALGTVKLADAPVDPAQPKAHTVDQFVRDGAIPGTLAVSSPATSSKADLIWYIHEDSTKLVDAGLVLKDGGGAGDTHTVEFYEVSAADLVSNSFGTAIHSVTATTGSANEPAANSAAPGSPPALTKGNWLVAKITAVGATAAGADAFVTAALQRAK